MRTRKNVVWLVLTSLIMTLGASVLTATPAAAADVISFRASAQSAATQTTHRVTIPATVRETDALLLFVTGNRANPVAATPAGWTRVGSRLDTDTETILYSKVAAANDAGRSQAVVFTASTKATLTLLAYDGTAADPIGTFASAAETVTRTTHTTPGASVSTAGSWVVSYWADKSSATTGWTLPAGQTQRSMSVGIGDGRITSVASDQNGPAPVGASPPVPPRRVPRPARRRCGRSCSYPTRALIRTWPPSRRSRRAVHS